jgi:hypothetical protein
VEVDGTRVKSPGWITWFWRGEGRDPREITWLGHLAVAVGGQVVNTQYGIIALNRF